MKFMFPLRLAAALLLAPLTATAADDTFKEMACGLVQDAYDSCPNGICKAGVVKLNKGTGCSLQLESAVLSTVPTTSPWSKPLSALAGTQFPIVEKLKAKLAALKSSDKAGGSATARDNSNLWKPNGGSATALDNPNLWKPNPGRKIRKLVGADGTVIDPFAADTAPNTADLNQFFAKEKQRIEEEEQREHERAVENERQRLLAAQREREREEERRIAEAEERRQQRQAEAEQRQQRLDNFKSTLETVTNAYIQAVGGGGQGGGSSEGARCTTESGQRGSVKKSGRCGRFSR